MSVISTLTAPARFVLRTTLHALEAAAERGREAVGRVVPEGGGDDQSPAPEATPVRPPSRPDTPAAATATPAAPVAPTSPLPGTIEPDRTEQPEFQPVHLDEEPADVVYSSSDEGAHDGAGATLHVAEPWKGYRDMTAPDVVDRLAVSDSATLATVQLYETANRGRKTILAAVERHLATAS